MHNFSVASKGIKTSAGDLAGRSRRALWTHSQPEPVLTGTGDAGGGFPRRSAKPHAARAPRDTAGGRARSRQNGSVGDRTRRLNHKLIIAIDGPAGSGKSTVAKIVAAKLEVPYIDTGAMYRAVTLKAMRLKVPFLNIKELVRIAKNARIRFGGQSPLKQRVFLDGRDVSREIRVPELTRNVFHVAQEALVRRQMVRKQHRMGKLYGAVMEGRDIGTMVFPKADYKFFLDAKAAIRARRRHRELVVAGHRVSYAKVLRELVARDKTDIERKEGPLRQAKDAIYVDTSKLTIEQSAGTILKSVRSGSSRKPSN